jgi:hypothetical protein
MRLYLDQAVLTVSLSLALFHTIESLEYFVLKQECIVSGTVDIDNLACQLIASRCQSLIQIRRILTSAEDVSRQ